jgi:hypothetical protein
MIGTIKKNQIILFDIYISIPDWKVCKSRDRDRARNFARPL